MQVGDLVKVKSGHPGVIFCIIDFKTGRDGKCVAVLKGIYNEAFMAEAPVEELINVLPKDKL